MIIKMKISIPYWVIVCSDELCNELWVNERCVNEWVVDSDDTVDVEITNDNIRILEELKDLVLNGY